MRTQPLLPLQLSPCPSLPPHPRQDGEPDRQRERCEFAKPSFQWRRHEL